RGSSLRTGPVGCRPPTRPAWRHAVTLSRACDADRPPLLSSNMSTNEAIDRLEAAIRALGEVDLTDWSDSTLHTHLDELSAALCEVDAHLARLADAVRARGYRVAEPVAG